MTEFFDHYSSVLYIVGIVVQFFIGWFAWSMRKEFVPQKDHDTLKDRVTTLENKIQTVPSMEALHALSIQLTKLEGVVGSFNVRFESMGELSERLQTQVDRMEDFLDKRAS